MSVDIYLKRFNPTALHIQEPCEHRSFVTGMLRAWRWHRTLLEGGMHKFYSSDAFLLPKKGLRL